VLLALLPLLALHIVTPPAIPEPRVVMTETKPRLVLKTTLLQMCGRGTYDACTKFVGYKLRLNCSMNGTSWNIDGSAEFTPMILLMNPERLQHEQRHIDDVRVSAERYLDELGTQSFDTFGACEEQAFNERLIFGKRLYDFAAESTRLRDQ
jgi:hypothetical protein